MGSTVSPLHRVSKFGGQLLDSVHNAQLWCWRPVSCLSTRWVKLPFVWQGTQYSVGTTESCLPAHWLKIFSRGTENSLGTSESCLSAHWVKIFSCGTENSLGTSESCLSAHWVKIFPFGAEITSGTRENCLLFRDKEEYHFRNKEESSPFDGQGKIPH